MALPKAALVIVTCVLSLNGVTSYEVYTMAPCFTDQTVWLGSNDKSALNFSLGNFKIDPLYPDPNYFKCSFHIEADRHERIIAVIQRMNLRGNDFTCLDYVELSDVPKLSVLKLYDRLNNQKKQICGHKNVSIMTLPSDIVLHAYDKYTVPQNVYISNRNEMKVKVSISRAALKRDETLDFQIIFTAAKVGSECNDRSQFDCGNKTCIWKGFYKDGFMNCPYAGCPDEDGCEAGPIVKYSSGSGTTIIICAVVSMLSVLGMFLLCLFICRRCKVLCWAHRPPSTRDPAARVHVSSSLSHPGEAAPSAPPLISLHDKDLPPSYDSLFPARITEERVWLVKDDGNVPRDACQVCKRSRNVSDDANERCRRPKDVPSDKSLPLGVRVEGQGHAMRYCRNLDSTQTGSRREAASSGGANRRHPHPHSRSSHPNRGRYSRNHRPGARPGAVHPGRDRNSNPVNSRSRSRSRNRNTREI